jgi:hypothetical protein
MPLEGSPKGARLVDLGIARGLDVEATGMAMGSPQDTAPEQSARLENEFSAAPALRKFTEGSLCRPANS